MAGVDACRGGWIAIVVESGRFTDSLLRPTFASLLDGLHGATHVGVDIPIGLPEEGVRAADVAAREFIGPRRSSVFPAPPRAVLAAATYGDARGILPSLSAQSFALAKRILEVEGRLEERVFEVHPEVSFAVLAGRHLRYAKRSWNGQMERRRLLRTQGLELPAELAAGGAAADDVLDAAAAAWSAGRPARGRARSLPREPPIHAGRAVAIWYWRASTSRRPAARLPRLHDAHAGRWSVCIVRDSL